MISHLFIKVIENSIHRTIKYTEAMKNHGFSHNFPLFGDF